LSDNGKRRAPVPAVIGGLSMPHSPRIYAGRLWVLNSGTGEIG
jgi:hypothetical protein